MLQGDVGSGKTIVAVLCMLMALDNNVQATLVAPTEILAQQHYSGIKALLAPLGVEMGLLTGSVTKKIFAIRRVLRQRRRDHFFHLCLLCLRIILLRRFKARR